MFRKIPKRPAMTGSGLGRYARAGQPRGFGGVGPGPTGAGEDEPSGTSGTLYLFSGISHEKNVHKKDPGKCWQCAGCAGTCPVRCLVYRAIVKRPAITGSGLGRYAESGPAPGFRRGRVGPDKMRFGMGNPGSFWAMIISSLNPVLEQNFVIYSLGLHHRTGKICSKKAKDVDQRKSR